MGAALSRTHELYVLDRPAGGKGTTRPLEARTGRISARSEELADRPAVIVATERMDEDPAGARSSRVSWCTSGTDLAPVRSTPFEPPSELLRLSDLDSLAAASQHPGGAGQG